MDQKSDLIREDLNETRSALTEKLVTLEDELRGKVESARETVEDTIENVKAAVRKVSPKYQVQQRPFLLVGGSIALGIAVGKVFQSRRSHAAGFHLPADRGASPMSETSSSFPQTSEYEESGMGAALGNLTTRAHEPLSAPNWPPDWMVKLTDTFSDEIEMVKGMALGAAIDALRGVAEAALPDLKAQIDDVLDSAKRKVGAPVGERPRGEGAQTAPPGSTGTEPSQTI